MDLNNIKMNVIKTAPNGKVGIDTIFEFTQYKDTVSAKYSGGRIQIGYLVGKMNGDKLVFRYSQMDNDGNLDGGISECILRMNENKIQLVESFTWESIEGEGTNIFQEVQ